jgi:hypothetical protein
MFVAPLEGWRRTEITERKAKKDWSHQITKRVDFDIPRAEKINLAMDNLSTQETVSDTGGRREKEKREG